jgi:energy-coupling factor transport system permease protein
MGLAEAMVARGYGAVSDRAQPLRLQALLSVGLLSLLGGWLAWLFLPSWAGVALGAMVAGGGLVLGSLWLSGRATPRTSYRARRWSIANTLVVLGCGLALIVLVLGREVLAYTPYPRMTLPPFDPVLGLGLLGLLAPAVGAMRAEPE